MEREIDPISPATTTATASASVPTPEVARRPTEAPLHGVDTLVGEVLSSGRYFILLAIIGSFITSCAVLIYAFFAGVVDAFGEAIQHEFDADGAKHVSVEVISLGAGVAIGVVLVAISLLLRQFHAGSRRTADDEEI